MPQYGRRKPFSTKQKKSQLQRKRDVQRGKEDDAAVCESAHPEKSLDVSVGDETEEDPCVAAAEDKIVDKLQAKFEVQDVGASSRRQDRYKLMFSRESGDEVEIRKRESRRPVLVLPKKGLEVSYDDIYQSTSHIAMPVRPKWDYSLSKQQLEAKEQRYFNEYVDKLMAETHDHPLSYFELNLETWRQLWRVLEMSDVVMVISDARHPILHFPPSLYRHVVEDLKKTLVLVINKIDLVPATAVLAWREYFYRQFPELHVVLYTAKPGNLMTGSERADSKGLMSHAPSGAKRRMISVGGARQLIRTLADIVADHSILSEWTEKLSKFEVAEGEASSQNGADHHAGSSVSAAAEAVSYLTIGLVGHPNVGKSSLLNSLVGKKVVSASRTPGHTKHFQTYFLTPHIRLCDSPGLVFPSRAEKQLQILSGMYPISQVREPYTSIGYLACRLGEALLHRLGLTRKPPCGEEASSSEPRPLEVDGHAWSAWELCEAWAEERGYRTAKGARPDVYRAANQILRLATDGRICLYVRPPQYTEELTRWMCHPDLKSVVALQREGLDKAVTASSYDLTALSSVCEGGELSDTTSSGSTSSAESSDSEVAPSLATSNPFAQLGNGDSD